MRLDEPVRERGILTRRGEHLGECTGPGDSAICPTKCREFLAASEVEITVECLRCGHGMVWHSLIPIERSVADEVADLLVGTNPTACAENCQICDLIEKVIEIEAAGRELRVVDR